MPIPELFIKTILGSLIREGVSSLKKIFENTKIELVVSYADLESAIYAHNEFVINSTKSISFKDLKGSKSLSDVYIELDIQLEARSRKLK